MPRRSAGGLEFPALCANFLTLSSQKRNSHKKSCLGAALMENCAVFRTFPYRQQTTLVRAMPGVALDGYRRSVVPSVVLGGVVVRRCGLKSGCTLDAMGRGRGDDRRRGGPDPTARAGRWPGRSGRRGLGRRPRCGRRACGPADVRVRSPAGEWSGGSSTCVVARRSCHAALAKSLTAFLVDEGGEVVADFFADVHQRPSHVQGDAVVIAHSVTDQ